MSPYSFSSFSILSTLSFPSQYIPYPYNPLSQDIVPQNIPSQSPLNIIHPIRHPPNRAPGNRRSILNLCYNYSAWHNYSNISQVEMGRMDKVCTHCRAKKWKGEPPGLCCLGGQIKLEPLTPMPQELKELIIGDSYDSVHFRKNIRAYNACFQMTSLAAKEIREPGFMPTYKIQGVPYHTVGSLMTRDPTEKKNMFQLYFVGEEEQLNGSEMGHLEFKKLTFV